MGTVASALASSGLSPTRLELEITETVLLDHSQNTETFIAELAKAGGVTIEPQAALVTVTAHGSVVVRATS